MKRLSLIALFALTAGILFAQEGSVQTPEIGDEPSALTAEQEAELEALKASMVAETGDLSEEQIAELEATTQRMMAENGTASAEAQSGDTSGASSEEESDFPEEGLYFKPFPLLNYNSDLGLGFGASVSMFKYDGESDLYGAKVYAEYMMYTGGQMDPDVRLDIPELWIGEIPISINGFIEFKHARFQPYYGTNNTDAENNYSSASATNTDFTLGTNQNKYFYMYDMVNPYMYLTVKTPVLWGRQRGYDKSLDIALGTYLDYYQFTNSYTKTDGVPEYKPSKLMDEMPIGSDGGLMVSLYGGVSFDSRDFIPNPHSGTYNEIFLEYAFANKNKSYDESYLRLSVMHKAYWQPFANFENLVLAERIWVDSIFGDKVPFFKQNKVGGSEYFDGLGSGDTLRGVSFARITGKFKFFVSPEIRLRFLDFNFIGKDKWHLEFVPFMDIGGGWEDTSTFDASEIQICGGAGLKVLWGEDFIISFDYGMWKNEFDETESGIYIGFGHQF